MSNLESSPATSLRDVSVETSHAVILKGVDLTFAARGVTVLLGPVGTGKSTLLRLLAGETTDELRVTGQVSRPPGEVLFLKQTRDAAALGLEPLRHALAMASAELVLVDEPDRRVAPGDIDALVDILCAAGKKTSLVMVTHHLELARRVADDIHLLCAGGVIASGKGDALFRDPPNELAAHFVREGNCWPTSTVTLPTHFRWFKPGELAGMGKPGLLRDIEDDLASIALEGISLLVTLTEEAPPVAPLRSFGLASRHFPIVDMNVPAIGATTALCRDIVRAIANGERVAIHCHAGLGRTGTILASVLVYEGMSAADAIASVRRVEPKSIQNRAQESFVERFEESLRGE